MAGLPLPLITFQLRCSSLCGWPPSTINIRDFHCSYINSKRERERERERERDASRSAAFPFQPKCSSLCGCSMPTEMQMLPLQRDLNCKCCPFRETERDASRSVAFPFQQKCCSLCGWPPSIINIHIIRRRPKRSISISTEVLLPLLLASLYY